MVDYVIGTRRVPGIRSENIETMRARRDNLPDAVVVQRFQILVHQHLGKVLISARRAGSPLHFSSLPRIA